MLSDCNFFKIDSFSDKRGELSFLQQGNNVMPFPIKRVYYLYETKENEIRGVHAHHKLEQVIIAISGKFEIKLDDGFDTKKIILDKPSQGLYLCPMIWRELRPLESNSICIVLASRIYEENDYIHEYEEFLDFCNSK